MSHFHYPSWWARTWRSKLQNIGNRGDSRSSLHRSKQNLSKIHSRNSEKCRRCNKFGQKNTRSTSLLLETRLRDVCRHDGLYRWRRIQRPLEKREGRREELGLVWPPFFCRYEIMQIGDRELYRNELNMDISSVLFPKQDEKEWR